MFLCFNLHRSNVKSPNRLISMILLVVILFSISAVVQNTFSTYFSKDSKGNDVVVDAKITIPNPTIRVCWILDQGSMGQATFSLGSLVKFNPGQRFIFYFVTWPNVTLDLSNISLLVPEKSEIKVRKFDLKYAYLPEYSKRKCKWTGIIIVKLYLHKVFSDINKIIYLDTDIINVAPIIDLWKLDLTDKVFAGTPKMWYGFRWINSGVMLYNLANLRKQPQKLWRCANRKTCFVDDIWHSYCVNKSLVYDLPYRYNIDLDGMKLQENRTANHVNEERHPIFYHLMNSAKRTYYIKSTKEIPKMKVVRGLNDIAQIVEKLFNIMQSLRKELDRKYIAKQKMASDLRL